MKIKAVFHFSIDFLDRATGHYLGGCSGFADSDQEIVCSSKGDEIEEIIKSKALKSSGHSADKVKAMIESFTLVSPPGIGK